MERRLNKVVTLHEAIILHREIISKKIDMSKTKQDYITELVLIAFKIDEKINKIEQKTRKVQRMASLARQGMKESKEFKQLENEFKSLTVVDFGNEMIELKRVVRYLKKYKW